MPYRSKEPPSKDEALPARFLWTPTRGVRATLLEDTWLDEARSFALVMPPDTAFSHTTAAALVDLPLPMTDPRPFHFTSDSKRSRGRRKKVTWHKRHLGADVISWEGLAVTHPLRTLRDLAETLDIADLVAIADVMLRREWCTQEELAAIASRTALVAARLKVRTVAQLADPGSWSPRESKLRVALHDEGLPPPELNVPIIENGVLIGTGDLVWRRYRTIADYDGVHHEQQRQRHQDAQTRDDYAAAGWRHLVVTSAMSDAAVVGRVKRALRQGGWLG